MIGQHFAKQEVNTVLIFKLIQIGYYLTIYKCIEFTNKQVTRLHFYYTPRNSTGNLLKEIILEQLRINHGKLFFYRGEVAKKLLYLKENL